MRYNSIKLLPFLCFAVLLFSAAVKSSEQTGAEPVTGPDYQAYLVTYGPGEIYWERFGHNAIWLKQPSAGLDHSFNFGFFDFNQENFFLHFIRGRMWYFSVAQPAAREFDFYRQQKRSIRLQKLDLSLGQYEKLRDYLLNEVKLENRDYRYDYYLNNCSTRIRDALDNALDGALFARTRDVPAELDFRDQTRRLTQMQFWYYLGLETGLGYPVDSPVSRWDEMFIPMVVADEIAAMTVGDENMGRPLVTEDQIIFAATVPAPSAEPTAVWYRYFLLGLLVTGLAWLSGKLMPPVWLAGLAGAWILICSSIGLVLAALWLLTDHAVTSLNANLLLLNPLFVSALIPAMRTIGAILLAGGVAICIGLLMLPSHQYNLDVLALLVPVNLAVAVYFFRASDRS